MTVEIKGLKELVAGLRKADRDLPKAVSKAHREIARKVAAEARRRAPARSGRLRASIRPSGTARGASVRMGGAKVPYAGVQEFGGTVPVRAGLKGGRRRRIKPYVGPLGSSGPWWTEEHGYFLYPAARSQREEIIREYWDTLDEHLKGAIR